MASQLSSINHTVVLMLENRSFEAAADGKLAAYTFVEPSWSSSGNSQHPNYNVALGEQLIHDVY